VRQHSFCSIVVAEETTHIDIGLFLLGLFLNFSGSLSGCGGGCGASSNNVNGVLGSFLHLISLLEAVVSVEGNSSKVLEGVHDDVWDGSLGDIAGSKRDGSDVGDR